MSERETYNAATVFVDSHLSAGRADKPAFIAGEETLTYGQLHGASRRMVGLLDRLGHRREERVAMIVLDCLEFPQIFWGAIRAGVVPVAINTLLAADQYRYILNDCRARTLFVSAALLPTVAPILGELAHVENVLVVGGDAGAHKSFGDELAASTEGDTAATHRDETAFWLYSSGSTGMPKGVTHVQTSLEYTAETYGKGILGMREDDVIYSAAKLFFAYGLGNAMTFPMSAGATTVLLSERPTPDSVFATLNTHNPTIFFGVPTLYGAMLAQPDCGPEKGSNRLRLCVSAGEALPPNIGNRWQELFGVPILDGVGSTEMLHIFLSNQIGNIVYGTSGKAFDGYDLRLVDETGAEVPEGEVGELLVRGASSASGYWNQREKTRATFDGEWTRTGDKYTRDADGRYTYCGRTDDMFKVSGIWVSPFEVEFALISHDAVVEAAVVPAEDEEKLLKPKAFVILKDGITADDALSESLREHVKEKIGKWKYPRWINFVDELPKTATGKIQRFKLRD